MQFQALAVSLVPVTEDRSLVLRARTHCAQHVQVAMTRQMARAIAAEIIRMDGCELAPIKRGRGRPRKS